MLATTLLEGYTANDWDMSSNTGNISDALAYIQEASVEFITESANLMQQYYLADIVGQASVLTEGADPQVVMEANKASLWQKFKNLIKTLIKKIKEWLKKIKDWFKKLFNKTKQAKQVEAVEKVIKTMDKDEPIRMPAPAGMVSSPGAISGPTSSSATSRISGSSISQKRLSGPTMDMGTSSDHVTCALIPLNMDDGDDCANRINATLMDVWGGIANSISEINRSVMSGGGSDQWDAEQTQKTVEDRLGFPVSEISSKIRNAYGMDEDPVNVIVTAGVAQEAINVLSSAEQSVEVALKNAEQLPKFLEQYERDLEAEADKFNYADETIFVIMASANVMVQSSIVTNNAIVSAYNALVTQCKTVISAVNVATQGGRAVIESTGGSNNDDDFSDPPSNEDDEPVTEGLNIDIIKKYLNGVRDHLKTMREAHKLVKQEKYKEAKKKYQTAKDGLSKVYKEFQNMADDKISTNLTGIPTALVSGLLTMFDDILSDPLNILTYGADMVAPGYGSLMRKNATSVANIAKTQTDTHGDKNVNLTVIMSKINACIDRCDRCIKACDKKMKSVTEGYSIWEQAADYM